MKRTDVELLGVESSKRRKMVNNVTENLIPTNLILSFPPGVACFVQPNELATVAFTSFVPVRDTKALPKHLSKYDTVSQKVALKKKHKRQEEPPAKKTNANVHKIKETSPVREVINIFEQPPKT